MQAADTQWQQFYLSVQRCRPASDQPPLADQLLSQSAASINVFLQLATTQPAAMLAQLNLTPRQLTIGPARLIKALVIALILGRKSAWSAERLQNLLQAILFQHFFAKTDAGLADAMLSAAKALQLTDKRQKLIPLLVAGGYARRQPHWQLHPDGPLLLLATQLASLLLPESGAPLTLQQVLTVYRSKFPQADNSNWYNLLQHLPECETLPGRFARDQQQTYWFICGTSRPLQGEDLQAYVRQFEPASKYIDSDATQLALADLSLLSAQYFRQTEWLELFEPATDLLPETEHWSLQRSLDHSLYAELATLSVSAQVARLEQQPLVVKFLCRIAKQSSRQQLPVNRLRHAITMLGQDSLAEWVAQAELYQYCNRTAHPHQHWLEQLQHCLQQALLIFSSAMAKPLALHSAGLISCCLSAPLWQLSTLRNTALARQVHGDLALNQILQHAIWRSPQYAAQIRQLLLHYQQANWADATASWHSRQPAALTLLLQLSWQLTLAVFCGSEPSQQRLKTLLETATKLLRLPRHNVTDWQHQLMAGSHCYFPLPVM
tara:strand:- start:3116 stop:4762 length:1647 start_codon:yes stop_codon:yes gene_type:complete